MGSIAGQHALLSWVTDIGNHHTAVLQQGTPNAPSAITPLNIQSWSEFKDYVTSLEPNRYIFRGHGENTWRLRTYFHRTGRADLRRFIREDIPALHRHLSGLTQHVFNLADPIETEPFTTSFSITAIRRRSLIGRTRLSWPHISRTGISRKNGGLLKEKSASCCSTQGSGNRTRFAKF
jgi:hypothetical protein